MGIQYSPFRMKCGAMWGTLLESFPGKMPANIENRFVRLCNSYDDMISYLSFGAPGLFPPPAFCARVDKGRELEDLAP
ncbi:uncharacterized protein C8R40DRAFT_632511 [Lentinula edodes]|uniref:uncharacterized protein n=1 Tax=Lentinula edodes TaxID=5353 RepID=UPI001E8E7882|nr:uncharacterized protein C8R40DRAFT_632511 [Lentinula edodes]KAH7870589.1 hypothetical protein C8R40DRAFT_632511 [Lentinula edodes]